MSMLFLISTVVGYFTKNQPAIDAKTGLKYPTGIISFQWNKVDGNARLLNDVLKCSWGGQAWESPDAPEATPGWEDGAPMIQIRESVGSYTLRYFAKDAYDLDSGEMYPAWCSTDGFVDKELTVAIGQGAWVSCPNEDGVFTLLGAVPTTETTVGGDSTTATVLAGGNFPVAFLLNGDNVTWTCEGAQAWESPDAPEATPGWEDGAPMIQIRESVGSYTLRYYAKDAYDLDSGEMYPAWCSTDGFVDKEVGVAVGGGFWLSTPINDAQGKKTVYLKVANPLAK